MTMLSLSSLTILWVALPFFMGFSMVLLPILARPFALGMAVLSIGYAADLFLQDASLTLHLLDQAGVTLMVDGLSGFFILTNGLVTAAVALYCWNRDFSAFFYTQLVILHGSVNAVFISADWISVYVSLEVISIAAFLLIAYPRSDRSVWVALRYLFVSNTAMLFYLVGTVLVYQANQSFAFEGLGNAPPEAIALIFIGLLTKGGVFVSGLWLPFTHSEAATPVSAMLSGVVVKAGVYPLLRFAMLVDDLDLLVRLFGTGTALLGVTFAIFERDIKRMFALSTISQVGFVLAAPQASGLYALSHGLAKSSLFLTAGRLPSRNLNELKQQSIPRWTWLVLAVASLSIIGVPLLAGFGAKTLTMSALLPWQQVPINVAAVGTALVFSSVVGLPFHSRGEDRKDHRGFWVVALLLSGCLIALNVSTLNVYTFPNIAKALIIAGLGGVAYRVLFQRINIVLPRTVEQFDHLIGLMMVLVVVLFWGALI